MRSKGKPNNRDQVKLALRRLAEDDEVRWHLRHAAIRLREVYDRAARRPPAEAVEDKKLYSKLRQAATSLTKAVSSLRAAPPPPKRRGRKLALVAAAAGGTAIAVKKRSASSGQAPPPDPPPPASAAPAASSAVS